MTKKKPLTCVVGIYRCVMHRTLCEYSRYDVNLRLILERGFAKKNNKTSVPELALLSICYYFKGICACEFHFLGFEPTKVLLSYVQKPKL